MSHRSKIWEKILEKRTKIETSIPENQFGVVSGKSIIELLFWVAQLGYQSSRPYIIIL